MYNLRELKHMRRAVDSVAKIQDHDHSTGLLSRELFMQRIADQWGRAQKAHRALGLAIVEIDGFDEISGRLGRAKVENLLGRVGCLIAANCRRRADLAGRLDKGSVGVLFCDVTQSGVMAITEKIRAEVAEAGHELSAPPVTVSIGVSCNQPPANRFVRAMMIAAERAVQTATDGGGNRVVGDHRI